MEAVTRSQARASEQPYESPEAKAMKEVNPKDPEKFPRTPNRCPDGGTPFPGSLESSQVGGGPAPVAEADRETPLKLHPYRDDSTFCLTEYYFADGDVVYTNTPTPIVKVLDKRRTAPREPEYLVRHADGETHWTPRSQRMDFESFISEYENLVRSWYAPTKACLPYVAVPD
ncbi:hypothetical protein B5M09_013410 [Aphanomyces astaci]|uniref:Uncharacterized protein n=1 Tax=Aphanomyces astaci TaxID=112090 RepID=A0A3R7WM43_APHAT|nr:hypothetical protein B5M09_013410 [Aphanomyces astaci]